jgi:hypothetical protein
MGFSLFDRFQIDIGIGWDLAIRSTDGLLCTGENIAAEVFTIIDLFGIGDKVGYATLDNAPNNDTAMDSLGETQ